MTLENRISGFGDDDEEDWGVEDDGGEEHENKFDVEMENVIKEAAGNTENLQWLAHVEWLGFKVFDY